MRAHALLVLAFVLPLASGCGNSRDAVNSGGVTVQVIDAHAVNGGCGDASAPVEPDGGYLPCGPDTDFSVTISLLNTTDQPITVGSATATLMTVDSGQQLGSADLKARDGFDGTLAPGASVTVIFDLTQGIYGGGWNEDVYYEVKLSVGDKTLTVKSPPTPFRPSPA